MFFGVSEESRSVMKLKFLLHIDNEKFCFGFLWLWIQNGTYFMVSGEENRSSLE